MKKTNLTTMLFSLVLVTLSITVNTSCNKDRIEIPPEEEVEELNEYQSVNNYLDSKKQDEQDFEITGPSNDTIIGNQGSRIYGSKNCLNDANGDTIDYPFTIHLVELYTPKDMIYWQMPTVAKGNILETDGEIRIRATKDGQDLSLICNYGFEMPNSAPNSNMTIYKGTDNGTFVDWTNTGVPFTLTSYTDVGFTYGYKGLMSSFGWLNADIDASNSSSSTITFTSTTDNLANVGIFIYIPSTKTVTQVYGLTSGAIPNCEANKIILIAQDGSGQLFSYTKSRTANANITIALSLSSTSGANLTTHLDAL